MINYKENPNWDEEVLKLTNGEGVDHIIEVGGADTVKKGLNVIRVGGNVHVVGGVSGYDTGFPLGSVVIKAVTIRGIVIGTFLSLFIIFYFFYCCFTCHYCIYICLGSLEMHQRLNASIVLHKIKPQVDKVY